MGTDSTWFQGEEIVSLLESRKQHHDMFLLPRGSGSAAKIGGWRTVCDIRADFFTEL
jgi:hypothetical protein